MRAGPFAPPRLPLWLLPVVVAPLLLALPFLAGRVFLFRDLLEFTVPLGTRLADAFRHWHLPQWDPLLDGGKPLLAEPGTGVLYPPSLVFLLLPPARAATAFVLLHLPLAGAGAFALARTLGLSPLAAALAGVGYVESGYVLSMHAGHYYFAGAAWLPAVLSLLLRAADRGTWGNRAAAAAALALMTLSGELQSVAFAGLLALPLALVSPSPRLRALLGLLAGGCLGALLAAVQLLPTLLYASTTVRRGGIPLAVSGLWPLHPARWIEFVLPHPFGLPYPENATWVGRFVDSLYATPWAPSLFIGPALLVPVLALRWSGLEPRWRVLLVAAPLALLLAAGTRFPLFEAYFHLVPLASRFRYPEKFALLVTLALVLLGAKGLTALLAKPGRGGRLFLLVAVLLLAGRALVGRAPGGLVDLVREGLARSKSTLPPEEALQALGGSFTEAALIAILMALAFRLALTLSRVAEALVVAIVLLAGLPAALRTLSYGNGAFFDVTPPLVERLRASLPTSSAGRFLQVTGCEYPGGGSGTLLERQRAWDWFSMRENVPSLFGLPNAMGYTAARAAGRSLLLRDVARARGLEQAARLLGAAVVMRCPERGRLTLETVRDPLPRAYVAPALSLPAEQIRRRLAEPSFDPGSIALVDVPTPAGPGRGEARVVADAPEEVAVAVSGEGGLLVLVDSFAEGWTASVDGQRVPILRANALWRGVPVGPGARKVVFRYRAPGLAPGVALSILTALGLLAAIARSRAAPGNTVPPAASSPASPL